MNNERGQALVEYILILVVSVALILGLMFEFNTAFKAWANNYFGDYLTCLLETGELPSIGGSPGDSGVCNQFFATFSLKNGRPSVALSKKGGGTNGTNGARTTGAHARNEGSSSGRSGSYRSGNWGSGSNTPPPLNTDEQKGEAAAKKTGNVGISSNGYGGSSMNPRRNMGGGNQISGRLSGGFKRESEDKKGYSPGTNRAEGEGHSPKRLKVKPTRKPTSDVPESAPLTFGNFIRILIIAAIIIALVVVVGGQLLQITKGMDGD